MTRTTPTARQVARALAALFFALLAVAAALVSAPNYWIPVTVSLLSFAECALLVSPFWRNRGMRIMIVVLGAPLLILMADTLRRLIGLIIAAATS